MSATNLDLPVLISPEQIRRREFVTIRRGYDPDQVRAYMDGLADQLELMQSLIRDARHEAEVAIRAAVKPSVDPYAELARRVGSVIREADAAAEEILGGAREDAERMTLEARTDADRIRTDAQARAEETRAAAEDAVGEARAEADRTIAGLAVRRDALVEQLGSMQERLLAVARDLELTMGIEGPHRPATDPAADDEGEAGPSPVESSPSVWAVDPADGPSSPPPAPAEAAELPHDEASVPSSEAPRGSEIGILFAEVEEVDYEELWEGARAMRLEIPEIPALDLDWGPEDDDLDPRD